MKFSKSFVVFINFVLIPTNSVGLKCYECSYWNGPGRSEAAELNHVSCANGTNPEKRFIKVCNPGHICASAYIEFQDATSVNSITSRRCIPSDLLIYDKCVSIKSFSDFDRLRKSSRILKFDGEYKIKNGTECGCSSQLCNSSQLKYNYVVSILILTVNTVSAIITS